MFDNHIFRTNYDIIKKICLEAEYRITEILKNTYIRFDISNGRERTIVMLYNTGKIVPQGQKNKLHNEFKELKEKLENEDEVIVISTKDQGIQTSVRYDILLEDDQIKIKESLDGLGYNLKIEEKPENFVIYRSRLNKGHNSLVMTQYSNGTLLIQGKNNILLDQCCDLVESIANPSELGVIVRFISDNEIALREFEKINTPQLINDSVNQIQSMLGELYNYLEEYDRKWCVASKCLANSKILLPEYSPYIMPVSKAFEGFTKKILVGIGLLSADHFKSKNAKIIKFNDKTDPDRKRLCAEDKYMDTYLVKLSNSLDMYRNFMMHSDDSLVTKVDDIQDAIRKVDEILNTMKELFIYFNNIYKLI